MNENNLNFKELKKLIKEKQYNYVYDFTYDLINSTLVMSFCINPDKIENPLVIEIEEISELNNKRYHPPDESCMANIEEFEIENIENNYKIKFDTGDSILHFVTLSSDVITIKKR